MFHKLTCPQRVFFKKSGLNNALCLYDGGDCCGNLAEAAAGGQGGRYGCGPKQEFQDVGEFFFPSAILQLFFSPLMSYLLFFADVFVNEKGKKQGDFFN